MGNKKPLLRYQDTYVFIDVSNIRSACLKTLGFRLDFVKLLDYFKKKYPNLKEVRYYEGIAKGDKAKRQYFNLLKKKGYTVCALERKSYNTVEIEEYPVKCPNCQTEWTAEITKERKIMKSNVDVYLASDMVVQASITKQPIRLILVSCDGDYAEAIKNVFKINKDASVGVLATSFTRDITKNTVSLRLKQLMADYKMPQYMLHDIDNLRNIIESKEKPKKK